MSDNEEWFDAVTGLSIKQELSDDANSSAEMIIVPEPQKLKKSTEKQPKKDEANGETSNENKKRCQPVPMTTTKLNHAVMNAQQDAFVISNERGVKVFNTEPLVLLRSIEPELTGNAKIASILHRSNLICFVGAGKHTKYPSNTAFVWDDKKKEIVLEYTVPGGPILNILMSTSRLVIVQEKKIHIFSFPNRSKMIRAEEIRVNPNGLAAMSVDDLTGQQLAFPGFKMGSVRLMNLNNLTEFESMSPTSIDAHESEICQLTINNQGTLLATGSVKGTIIRVFETRTQRLLTELRRGNVQATLHCLSFSSCSTFLAVSSDKGTLHVFGIRDSEDSSRKGHVLRHVGIKGNTNIAKVSLTKKVLACGFTKATSKSLQSLVVVCEDSSFHRFSFNADGNTKREVYDELLLLADEQEFWTKEI